MSVLYVGIFGVIVADRSVGIRRYLNKNTDRYLPTGSLMIVTETDASWDIELR